MIHAVEECLETLLRSVYSLGIEITYNYNYDNYRMLIARGFTYWQG